VSVLDAVLAQLEGKPHQRIRHAEARTTAELAAVRGLPVGAGLKALLMKAGGAWTCLVVRADERTDNRRVRHALGAQKLRFLRAEELASLGLEPGQVPPFGPPVLPCRLVADAGVRQLDTVAFTAGTWTDSFVLATERWVALAQPEWADLVAR